MVIQVELADNGDGTYNLTIPDTIPARQKITVRADSAAIETALLDGELGFQADTGELVLKYAGVFYDVTLTARP